jgi:hypothetical protein
MKRILVMLFLLGVFSVGCHSDSNNNSRSSPISPLESTRTIDVPGMYSTIQEAINAAGTGDFVRVAAGIYTEDIVISSKSFSLRGAGKGQTIILGSVKIYENSNTSFEAFTVKGGGIHVRNSSVRITGNEICESPTTGLWLENCPTVVISDNDIHHNGQEGTVANNSSGVIGSTIVTQNTTDGIVLNNSSLGLVGNIITSNQRDGISIQGFTCCSSPNLLENIVRDNGGVNNYDIICFGGNVNPTGVGNVFGRCMNCAECRSFGNPVTYRY